MKLSAGIGVANYDAVMESLTEEQFQNWMAFDAFISPIGLGRLDAAVAGFMAAVVRYLGLNVGEKTEVVEEITPQSFLPWLDDPESEETEEQAEQRERMEAIAEQVNMESRMIEIQAIRAMQ